MKSELFIFFKMTINDVDSVMQTNEDETNRFNATQSYFNKKGNVLRKKNSLKSDTYGQSNYSVEPTYMVF